MLLLHITLRELGDLQSNGMLQSLLSWAQCPLYLQIFHMHTYKNLAYTLD